MIRRAPFEVPRVQAPLSRIGRPMAWANVDTAGQFTFFLEANRSRPSAVLLAMRSFTFDLGIPRTETGQPLAHEHGLRVDAIGSFQGLIQAEGAFAAPTYVGLTARTSVVEYDAAGRFVRSNVLGTRRLFQDATDWWWGHQTWTPTPDDSFFVVAPNNDRLGQEGYRTTPGYRYRVSVDTIAELRARGYGGIGGSYAMMDVTVTVPEVRYYFDSPRL